MVGDEDDGSAFDERTLEAVFEEMASSGAEKEKRGEIEPRFESGKRRRETCSHIDSSERIVQKQSLRSTVHSSSESN